MNSLQSQAIKRFKMLVKQHNKMVKDIANLHHKIYNKAIPYMEEQKLTKYKQVKVLIEMVNNQKDILNSLINDENIQEIINLFEADITDIKGG